MTNPAPNVPPSGTSLAQDINDVLHDAGRCPECGEPLAAGRWPWCPHTPVSGPHPVIMHSIRGGERA